MNALAAVRGEIVQTNMNMQTFETKASLAIENIGNLESQLLQTADQEELYELICNKSAHVLSNWKNTFVQFLD